MWRWGKFVALVVVALAGACGGASTSDGNTGGTSGFDAGGAGGTSAASGAGGFDVGGSGGVSGQPGECPAEIAAPGSICGLIGLVCRYDGVACWCTDQGWGCATDPDQQLMPCSQPGATCESPFYDCQCGEGGKWLCVGGGEDIPPPQNLPGFIAEGGYCGADWACKPEPPCGPKCDCEDERFECVQSGPCADPPCPAETPTGQCSLLGKTCQYTGFCAPTCRCMLQRDGSQSWECLTPPC